MVLQHVNNWVPLPLMLSYFYCNNLWVVIVADQFGLLAVLWHAW